MNIFTLFSIGALEKFSFNGIRSLLVMYLVTHLHFLAADSYKSYAAIMALGYMSPLVCGYISDRFIYSPQILIFSGLWVSMGMLSLLLPWSWGFYFAMAALVIGSGFIKTTVPALLGSYAKLYNKSEDALFAKLYVFFNIGSLLGTIGCSIVGELFGWNYGFMVAGLAMLIVCILSIASSFTQDPINQTSNQEKYSNPVVLSIKVNALIFGFILLTVFLLNYQSGLSSLMYIAFIFALSVLLYRSINDPNINFNNIKYLIYLMIIHTVFFSLYEQGNLSLVVFTDKMVNRSFNSFLPILANLNLFSDTFQMPVTFFQTIDPVLNILLGGFFVKIWGWIENTKKDFSFVAKFCLGLIFIAVAFLVLGIFGGKSSLVSPWLLILTYLFFVLGEQCVVPIGFSAVSSLSPKRFLAFCMGVWFVAIAISETLAERISVYISPTSINAGILDYQNRFLSLGPIILMIAFCFYLLYRAYIFTLDKKETPAIQPASVEIQI